MESLNFAIRFVKDGTDIAPNSAVSQTGDSIGFIVAAILMLLAICTSFVLVRKRLCAKANMDTGKAFAMGRLSKLSWLAVIVFAVCSLLMFSISINAYASNGSMSFDKDVLDIPVNSQQIKSASCNAVNNTTDKYIDISETSIELSEDASDITDLLKSNIKIDGLGGSVYDGKPNGTSYKCQGLSKLLPSSSSQFTFNISNLSADVANTLIDKDVFILKLNYNTEQGHHVIYNGGQALYDASMYGEAPVDTKTYFKGDKASVLGCNSLSVHGFVFDGWSYTNAAKKADVKEGEIIAVADKDIQLYAVWKAKYDGHRGCQTWGPENSIASFEAAANSHMWAIETDFRMTKDNQVICVHDASMDRTIRYKADSSVVHGLASDFTLQEIRDTMQCGYVNTKAAEATRKYDYDKLTDWQKTVPTMDEYFKICHDGGSLAFVELKEDDGTDSGVIMQMMQSIKKHDMVGKCVISSSDINLLARYRECEAKVNLGCQQLVHLIFGKIDQVDTMKSMGNAAIAFNYTKLDKPIDVTYHGEHITSLKRLVDVMHENGLQICYRAVDDQATLKKSIALQIDYYPTNCLYDEDL